MSILTPRRWLVTVTAFACFALVVAAVSPMIGAESINPWTTLRDWLRSPPGQAYSADVYILFELRLPRIAMAFLTGAVLAISGGVFQAILRNPLADPYTLGVASGGSFGATLAFFLPSLWPWLDFSLGPFSHVQVFAFAGATAAVGLIYALARSKGRVSALELLLAGVTLAMIFSALIMAVRYFMSPDLIVGIERWTMGMVDVNGWRDVVAALPFLIVGSLVLMGLAPGLDQISFGEAMAQGRGVNVARLQLLGFLFGSLAVGAVVAVAGPIGFVGLITPHTVRRLIGPDHRLLLPCSFLAGGAFLVACDTVARSVIAPTELPVGVITALLGGPFFMYLLMRRRTAGMTT